MPSDRRVQQHAYDYAGANRPYGLDSPLVSFKVVWLAAYQCAARLGKYCVLWAEVRVQADMRAITLR